MKRANKNIKKSITFDIEVWMTIKGYENVGNVLKIQLIDTYNSE